jgi:hypothetical protein
MRWKHLELRVQLVLLAQTPWRRRLLAQTPWRRLRRLLLLLLLLSCLVPSTPGGAVPSEHR